MLGTLGMTLILNSAGWWLVMLPLWHTSLRYPAGNTLLPEGSLVNTCIDVFALSSQRSRKSDLDQVLSRKRPRLRPFVRIETYHNLKNIMYEPITIDRLLPLWPWRLRFESSTWCFFCFAFFAAFFCSSVTICTIIDDGSVVRAIEKSVYMHTLCCWPCCCSVGYY